MAKFYSGASDLTVALSIVYGHPTFYNPELSFAFNWFSTLSSSIPDSKIA